MTSSYTGVNIPKVDTRYETLLVVEHPAATPIQTDIVYLSPPTIPPASISVTHYSLSSSNYDILEIDFVLQTALAAQFITTLSSPTQEMVFYLEFDRHYYDIDLGMTATGTYTYSPTTALASGDACDAKFTPSLTSTASFSKGDNIVTNPRIAIPLHDTLNTNPYTFKLTVPFVKNPSSANKPLNFIFYASLYDNNVAYPINLLYYNFYNHMFTTTASVGALAFTLTPSGRVQQTSQTLGLSITSPSITLSSASSGAIVLRLKTGYKSSSFSSVTVSGFTVFYFSVSQLFLLKPSASFITTTAITLNSLSIIDYTDTYLVECMLFNSQSYNSQGTQTAAMTALSSQPGTFTWIEGFTNYKSEGLYSLTFAYNPFTIPNNGVIKIVLPASLVPITNLGLGDYCQVISPTNEGTNSDSTTNSIFCSRDTSTSYKVQGFGSQGLSVSLSFKLYLKVNSASGTLTISSMSIYGIDSSTALIISPTFSASISISTTGYPASLTITNYFPLYVYANEWGPLSINFKTTTGSLQYANTASLVLTLPTGFNLPSDATTKVYAKYGPSGGTSWVTVTPSIAGQVLTIPIQQGYDIPVNTDYKLIINTVLAATNNGVERPDPNLYRFTLEWKDTATLQEFGIYDFKVIPKVSSASSLLVLNKGSSHNSIYKISLTPNRNVANTNFEIQTEYITNDSFNAVFADDLGLGMTSSQRAQEVSCSEPVASTVISATRISCVVWKGDTTTYTTAKMRTPIANAITSGTAVSYFVANIANPSISGYFCGIQVQVTQKCRNDGLMCVYFNSFVTFTTISEPTWSYNPDTIFNPNRGVSLSQSLIFTTGVTHGFTMKFSVAISAGDYLILLYPKYNLVLSDTCTSTYGSCLTFPVCNWVLLTLSASIASSTAVTRSIVITNARYVDATGTPVYVQAWSATTFLLLDAQQFNHPSYSPISTGFTLAITPTRTTPLNYWLKNFMNYASLTAQGIWYNSEVQWFRLVASSGVSYFDSYCNASLTLATPLRNNPYPARLVCTVVSNNVIRIGLYPNYPFPSFTSDFPNWQIAINFNFWIDSTTTASSITFTLYGCAKPYSNSYISKGTINFNIDPYIQPEFSDLTFNTNSFYDRIGLPSGKVEFYMLLRPSTAVTVSVVNKIVFTVPEEFAYPSLPFIYCEMKGATTYAVTSCQLQRIGGKTLVTLIPGTYNNEVKIVRLTSNTGNTGLFTNPPIGGNNYVLEADLYTGTQLVERGKANISEIYPGIFFNYRVY